jgi:phosphate starvation-inducible PhoH-like protein
LRKNHKNKSKKSIDITNNIKPQSPAPVFKNRLIPRTINQKNYIRTVAENTITFCQGIAGSGKTHIAIGMALEYLLDGKVEKIIITRPIIEAGERLGYLPGTAEEKIHPYLLPLLDEVEYFMDVKFYSQLKYTRSIEIVPLGLMRGRNFHNSFIVADECQNASYEQLKMLLTRIGKESKMVLTGDVAQSDLPKYQIGGFANMMKILDDVDGIGMSHLQPVDIVRNPIIAKVIARLDNYESSQSQ